MVVETLEQLKRLSRGKKPTDEIQLQMKSYKDILYVPFQQKLNDYINECGCSWGSYFLTGGFVLALIFMISAGSITFWDRLGIAFLGCLVLAIVGKLIGLRVAKVKYYNTLKELIFKLEGKY